jgi:hypothetical protein
MTDDDSTTDVRVILEGTLGEWSEMLAELWDLRDSIQRNFDAADYGEASTAARRVAVVGRWFTLTGGRIEDLLSSLME